MAPWEFTVRPFGRLPEESAQTYGEVPPLALRLAVYPVPAVPCGRDVVLTLSFAEAIAVGEKVASAAAQFVVPLTVKVPATEPLATATSSSAAERELPVSCCSRENPAPALTVKAELLGSERAENTSSLEERV